MPVYPGAHNAHRPHRALQLEAPVPSLGGILSARIAKAAFIDVTCSVVCSMSTAELHERICAPFSEPVVAERAHELDLGSVDLRRWRSR
jgi:hypothetical protein